LATSAVFLGHALEQRHAELLVRQLAPAEAQRHLYLVAFFQELHDRSHLRVIIMIVDVRTHLDLLDLLRLLGLAGEIRLLLRLVFEFADIEELAHRRVGVGDTSTRSRPTSAACSIASRVYRTPRFSPFSSITRTLGTVMNSLYRGPDLGGGGASGRRIIGGGIAVSPVVTNCGLLAVLCTHEKGH
jgi:hypothetical protein